MPTLCGAIGGVLPERYNNKTTRSAYGLPDECNKSSHFVTARAMTTTAVITRRPRGFHPNRAGLQQSLREKVFNLPEYLELVEIEAIIALGQTRWRSC